MTDPIVIYRCRKCDRPDDLGRGGQRVCQSSAPLWDQYCDWQKLHVYDPETHILTTWRTEERPPMVLPDE